MREPGGVRKGAAATGEKEGRTGAVKKKKTPEGEVG